MKNKFLLAFVLIGMIFVASLLWSMSVQRAEGSVSVTNEYQATTTDSGWSTATTQCKDTLTSFLTLGSVVITKTSNATLMIYDATTTGPHSNHATTTIAAFPLTTVGQYTFDVGLKRGLCAVVDTTVGVASSTITFR